MHMLGIRAARRDRRRCGHDLVRLYSLSEANAPIDRIHHAVILQSGLTDGGDATGPAVDGSIGSAIALR